VPNSREDRGVVSVSVAREKKSKAGIEKVALEEIEKE
jgi:hypothetical protein